MIYGKYIESVLEKLLASYVRGKVLEYMKQMPVELIFIYWKFIPYKLSTSGFMGYLKRKSSLMIFDRHDNLKYRYGN